MASCKCAAVAMVANPGGPGLSGGSGGSSGGAGGETGTDDGHNPQVSGHIWPTLANDEPAGGWKMPLSREVSAGRVISQAPVIPPATTFEIRPNPPAHELGKGVGKGVCLLYTSDAADDM
eukprot:3418230-Prymnesium_polylepis.1